MAVFLAACVAGALAQEPPNVEENVVYATVNGADLHLDIYKPAAERASERAAIMLIHGGGWTDLDKSTMRGMGQFLARMGYVGFAPDYRLYKGDGKNRWPAQLEDVERAVRWVRANSAKYGVDPDRIGAFGHSAGAQIAALLGMPSAVPDAASRVEAVVDVSGPSDFTADRDADGTAFLTKFLGADYAKNPRAWRDASPAFHAAKDDAPFVIVHGTQDQNVPIAQAEELFGKLQAAGATVSLVKIDDAHTFRTPEAKRRLALESLAFYNQYLGNKK